jgi:ATP-dependent protease Clp ATPase subunit
MQELSTDQLCEVLVTPKNALSRQYAKQFEMSQARLSITQKALQAIAVIAKDKGTGARGLRSIMERLLVDAMFDVSPPNVCACESAHTQQHDQSYAPWYTVTGCKATDMHSFCWAIQKPFRKMTV